MSCSVREGPEESMVVVQEPVRLGIRWPFWLRYEFTVKVRGGLYRLTVQPPVISKEAVLRTESSWESVPWRVRVCPLTGDEVRLRLLLVSVPV